MPSTIPWVIALVSGITFLALAAGWALLRRPTQSGKPLPVEWSLTPRPVFSADERRAYRLLREALPHQVILSKLPLVRFCQPVEAKEVRYWFELLGAIHVTFAICSPNGRVLAAVDLETERGAGSRSLQIKQSVLGACRVRYLRCPLDKLPSAVELQLLVPYSNSNARGPQAASATLDRSGPRSWPGVGASQRRPAQDSGRGSLWQDSAVFNDSFFAPDSRFDSVSGMDGSRTGFRNGPASFQGSRAFGESSFAEPLSAPSQYPDEAPNDIVGVVVDSPRYGGGHMPR